LLSTDAYRVRVRVRVKIKVRGLELGVRCFGLGLRVKG
jgi:hypothetical protein